MTSSTTRHRRAPTARVGAAALSAVGLILVSGCGGQGSPGAAPTVDFGSAGGPTPGMVGEGSAAAPMSGMSGMAVAQANPTASLAVASTAVKIENFAFDPASITVPVGATVTWTNDDQEPHTVVADGGSFHSPGMDAGATFSYTFTAPGTFTYICSVHPFMHATVVVTP
ncbi:plastocyanin [Rhodococcus spelaei]|uniref:Plastocyanin n=1 Tax=Rhodococcus spelaei TaxID=2546320 RepID=A0A541B7J3_9NOCA|nr:cupredoxin family copper-binding protein [Rhodococcus spelaei]TQF68296.1 plastocyanin [Rhodococcus spelaei]